MGGRLLLFLTAGIFIFITGVLSDQNQKTQEDAFSYNNIRNARSPKEIAVENEKVKGKIFKKHKGHTNRKQIVKRKKKTSKRKSIKKKAKESKRKNSTTQKGKKISRKNKEK